VEEEAMNGNDASGLPTGTLRISDEARSLLGGVSTATLCTQLRKRGYRSNYFMSDVEPQRPEMRMVGQAVTLRYIPARDDLEPTGDYDNQTNKQRLAIETVGPGDVLVIDARGETGAAVLGNILAARIKARGAAGIVTDGAFRDAPVIRTLDIPTYARGQNANLSNQAHFPSEINVPIACGDVAVVPGDVIVGDAEGVIVIPVAIADEVARDAAAQESREAFIFEKVQGGSSIVGVYPPNEQTLREYEQAMASANNSAVEGGRS
jgi:regulator of RNase E activity RraA